MDSSSSSSRSSSSSLFPLSSTTTSSSSLTSSSFSPSSSSSTLGWFTNINLTTWILIILILAFLGFNVFAYLAQGSQTVADVLGTITKKLFGATVAVTGQAVDVSAEGAKAVVGATAGAIEGGLTAVQELTPNTAYKGQSVSTSSASAPPQTPLQQSLNTAAQPTQPDYEAHEASSSVHSAGKAGWCFVGNDRGFRSCAQVGVNDTCMSGDIFPSQEICMNPNLRP